ncbi:MAG: acireductone synthase [Spirochaetia bacterium]|nr:acireductone synthase [Spirochaetia bacterium]
MNSSEINHFLFDIEGTTAPISFVHEVLFPYSKNNLLSYLQKNKISNLIFSNLQEDHKKDKNSNLYKSSLENSADSLFSYLEFLISVDRKNAGLKEIQGEIWKQGYESGDIKSQIFQDTLDFFQFIKKNNKQINIYSSGSILAQKLIFKYSNLGDMSSYITNYFDTGVGPKRDSNSYLAISKALNCSPNEIIFFTDIQEEADSALSIGIKSYLMLRKGNSPLELIKHPTLNSFSEWR